MDFRDYGDADAKSVLLMPSDPRDGEMTENIVRLIRERSDVPFRMIECVVPDWDGDLSPWTAPPVFGKEPFGGNAKETLEKILQVCPEGNICVLGGYSLAGLFALWAATETDRFAGVAAASPSMWFPGFTDHLRNHPVRTRAVCLSLGDREEKAKNPVMATVGDRIREGYGILKEQVGSVTLEWNEGNHFREPDLRTAKAFAWVLNALKDAGS